MLNEAIVDANSISKPPFAWPARWTLALFALFCTACSAIPVSSPHINIHKDGYVADEFGNAIDKKPPAVGETAEEIAVEKLMQQIGAQVAADCSRDGNSRTHLMLFVHGGLTSTRAAMASSVELDRSGIFSDREIRPIYINWNSSLNSAIADDIFWIRGGQRAPEGAIVFPIVAAWRLAIGVFNTLPNWYYQATDEVRFFQKWPEEPKPSAGEIAGDGLVGLVHAPFSVVSTPLFTGFGRGAWEMMSRRVDMMFAVQKAPRRFGRYDDVRPGVMRTFLNELVVKRAQWAAQCETFKLDFVGHSMGTLVGTRILREFPSLKLDRVVFLAGASTVEDYATTLPVYLERQRDSKFYSFGLSVIDEANELTPLSFVLPRGSLLVWIDNFFDPILSPEDYRVGDFFNETIFKAPLSEGDARCKNIRMLKVAGPRADRTGWPRKHGDFNDPGYLGNLLDVTGGTTGQATDAEMLTACGDQCALFDPCEGKYIESP